MLHTAGEFMNVKGGIPSAKFLKHPVEPTGNIIDNAVEFSGVADGSVGKVVTRVDAC